MNRGRTQRFTSRGRSSRSGSNFAGRHGPFGADGPSSDVPMGPKDRISHPGRKTSEQMSMGGTLPQSDNTSMSYNSYQQVSPFPGIKDVSSDLGNLTLAQNLLGTVNHIAEQPECFPASGSEFEKDFPSWSAQPDPSDKHSNFRRMQRGKTSAMGVESRSSSRFDCLHIFDTTCKQDESSPPAKFGIKDEPAKKGTQCGQTSHEKSGEGGRSENSDCRPMEVLFDICPGKSETLVRLKEPLHVKNREKRNEIKRSVEGKKISMLRTGMFLLKSYISCNDQVKIVKSCRELGLGSGGFYQPGYRDGTKLHLKMMCLGKNWDPETSKYCEERPLDGARPPVIPIEFHELVKGAIQDSHAHLRKQSKAGNVEDILPSMSPNICIVNFYSKSGRLGLHQDKDESPESLRRELPVVSFSIGDSAEFLYGEQRDVDKAEKITLESGDVLIFGGKSRHVFHGVTAILSDTAPKALLEESNLRPGRLNLTFREY